MLFDNSEQLETEMKIFTHNKNQQTEEKFKTLEYQDEVYIDVTNLSEKKKKQIISNSNILEKYSGIIIEKNCSIEQYNKLENIKAEYYEGFVIITELHESIVHGSVTGELNTYIGIYCRETNILYVASSASHFIAPARYLKPDGSILRNEPLPNAEPKSLFVFEVNVFSQSINSVVRKCLRYFDIDSINIVLLIQIYQRDVNYYNRFKAVAIVFDRQTSILRPSTMVSFGTQRISEIEEQFYNNEVGLGSTQITGFLYNNNNFNNEPNNPFYLLTIPSQNLLFQNVQVPLGLPPLIIDLFQIKNAINRQKVFKRYVD